MEEILNTLIKNSINLEIMNNTFFKKKVEYSQNRIRLVKLKVANFVNSSTFVTYKEGSYWISLK